LETQLEQAQRMEAVGRLAGGIAHDFNNLLTVIGGHTIFALRHAADGTQLRQHLEEVQRAAKRASALTQQLLTFSRRQTSEMEVLQVNDVVGRLESMLRPLIGEHITLRTLLAPGLGAVRANRVQVEQVVMNLALNARDAMPEGGTITIQTENVVVNGHFVQEQLRLSRGPYVLLSVSDTGVGMDAVTQARIFEPFFTTKGPGEGTGLGLATVYGLVQQAGGAIYVYSEPEHGSVFKVYLPRIEAPAEALVVSEQSTPPAHQAPAAWTVLLVEDEPGVRGFASQVLEEAGHRVLQAGSGEEALALAASFDSPIALLLTDVVMPGMNGRALAERLRELQPGVAVLYTSGYTDDMVVRAGVVAEGTAFLEKPYSPDTLLARVQALLPHSASRPPR
jgi:two-component system, cell cycle sensor histidine kinase and response regulator CckA